MQAAGFDFFFLIFFNIISCVLEINLFLSGVFREHFLLQKLWNVTGHRQILMLEGLGATWSSPMLLDPLLSFSLCALSAEIRIPGWVRLEGNPRWGHLVPFPCSSRVIPGTGCAQMVLEYLQWSFTSPRM